MNITTLFKQVNAAYRGSDDDPPTTGTDFALWLLTANRKMNEWATDAKNVWKSTWSYDKPNEPGTVATAGTVALTGNGTNFTDYLVGDTITVIGETVRTIATITSDTLLTVTSAFTNTVTANTFKHATIIQLGVQSYSVHRQLLTLSDEAKVATLTSGTLDYVVGKPQERSRYANEVYLSGGLPVMLRFYDAILVNDNRIGGTLRTPGYYVPNDFVAGTDNVTVDDPYWLVYAVAAELAFNDLTYSDKSSDLNNKANALYSKMSRNNRRGTSGNPRVAITNVNRIQGPESETGLGTL